MTSTANLSHFLETNKLNAKFIWYFLKSKTDELKKIPIGEKNNVAVNGISYYKPPRPTDYYDQSTKSMVKLTTAELETLQLTMSVYLKRTENLYGVDVDDPNIRTMDDFVKQTGIEVFKDAPWIQGNTKGIHIYVKVNDMPYYTDQQNAFTTFDGDFLRKNNFWERLNKEVHYSHDLIIPTVEYKDIQHIFNNKINKQTPSPKQRKLKLTTVEDGATTDESPQSSASVSPISPVVVSTADEIKYREYVNLIDKNLIGTHNHHHKTRINFIFATRNIGINLNIMNDVMKDCPNNDKTENAVKYSYRDAREDKTNKLGWTFIRDLAHESNPEEAKELDAKYGVEEDIPHGVCLIDIPQIAKPTENEEDSYILRDDVYTRGSYEMAKDIQTVLFKNLKLCDEAWYLFDTTTKLWSCVKEPSSYIIKVIYKFLNATTLSLSKKIVEEQDEVKQEALTKKRNGMCELYKKVDSSGYYSMLAKHLRGFLVDNTLKDKLDRQPYTFAFKNGVLDLRTKQFRHGIRYDDYLTQTLDFNYTKAKEEDIDFVKNTVLKKICNWNDSHLAYYLSVLSYSLIGHAELEKAMWYMVGTKGNNGKTTFLDVLSAIFPCYVRKGNSQMFEQGNTKQHKLIAGLKGVRLSWQDEFRKGKRMDEKLVKEMADGKDYINEVMFGTIETIHIDCKFICISNHKQVFEADGGIENRFKELKHDATFHDNLKEEDYEQLRFKKDNKLASTLKTDYRDAIVQLMIDGAFEYCQTKTLVEMPKEFVEATAETMEMNNTFKNLFETHCVVEQDAYTNKKLMAKRFNMTEMEIVAELKDKMGFKYERDRMYKSVKGRFCGVRLKTEEEMAQEMSRDDEDE